MPRKARVSDGMMLLRGREHTKDMYTAVGNVVSITDNPEGCDITLHCGGVFASCEEPSTVLARRSRALRMDPVACVEEME